MKALILLAWLAAVGFCVWALWTHDHGILAGIVALGGVGSIQYRETEKTAPDGTATKTVEIE